MRNDTGRLQVDSSTDLHLPPMGEDEWLEVPDEQAMRLWRFRVVQVKDADKMTGHWWKEPDGMHLFWASPFSIGDGYGTAAETMVLGLWKNGVKIHPTWCWFHSLYGIDDRVAKLLQEPFPAAMAVGICMATAGEFAKLPTVVKIGYTMYEADDPLRNLPEWRHDCECLDMLLVPSEHSKTIFSSFVDAPIQVVPLAVNPFYELPEPKKLRVKKPFVFGMHGTLTDRKSPQELARVFQKVFPGNNDVRLQLKTRLGFCGAGQNQIPDFGDHRIEVINDDWLRERVRRWLRNEIDCYVFPSKGEGWGMPPREAIASGVPTIFSNHTGMVDLADDRYNWPLPVHHEEQSPLGGLWRIPDWDALGEMMKWMYEHRAEALHKANLGAQWIAREKGMDQSARRMIEVLDKVDPNAPKKVMQVAETLDNGATNHHGEFWQVLEATMPKGGKILDLGFGEGILAQELTNRGYKVVVAVEPTREAHAREVLAKHGIEAEVVIAKGLIVSGVQADGCASLGVLQKYQQHEIELMLRSVLAVTNKVLFSVPTVHYPVWFGPGAHLRRLDNWVDLLVDFDKEAHYYGNGRYWAWMRVFSLDQGSRADTVKQAAIRGRVIDGTWKPLVRVDRDGTPTYAEAT